MKKSLNDKLKYLKDINETILALEHDITNLLNENENLLVITSDLKEQIKEKLDQNNKLTIELNSKNDELQTKTTLVNAGIYSHENENTFTLGINNLSVRNNEAIHDARSYFNKKCPYCGEELYQTTKRKEHELDHFFPVAKGGQDFPWNILPVCQSCNRKKKDTVPHKFLDHDTFQKVSSYLDLVHKKYLDESIDSYTSKEKIIELIKNENQFVRDNIHSKFISTLLYLTEQHSVINEIPIELEEYVGDETATKIIEYLNRQIPENWKNLNFNERKSFLDASETIIDQKSQKLVPRKVVCIAEIWCECFGKNKNDMNKHETRDFNTIMKKLSGWNAVNSTKNFSIYGKQRYYERKNTEPNSRL